MDIAIISDEISHDPHAAIYIGTKGMNIRLYELRQIMGKRVPDIAREEAEELRWLKGKYDIAYTAIAAGVFKCAPVAADIEHQLARLEKAIELALELGVGTITGFALRDTQTHRPGELRDIFLPYLLRALRMTERAGLTLAIETEYMTGVENARDAATLCKLAGPALRINWDPANSWIAGEHPLEGYGQVKPLLANMHVKDTDTRAWRERNPFVPFGDGLVPWNELLPLLARDRTLSVLTVETHCKPLIPNSLQGVARLRQALQPIAQEGAERP
ncbi:MAG: sugar phosphate isomerase/epimerase [Paenibacillaceae bacterium]|nr:sugar phosphate isomerase/epimerase [Paenibacillaceae bacterium]